MESYVSTVSGPHLVTSWATGVHSSSRPGDGSFVSLSIFYFVLNVSASSMHKFVRHVTFVETGSGRIPVTDTSPMTYVIPPDFLITTSGFSGSRLKAFATRWSVTNSFTTIMAPIVSFLVSWDLCPETVLTRVYTVKWPMTFRAETMMQLDYNSATGAVCSLPSRFVTGQALRLPSVFGWSTVFLTTLQDLAISLSMEIYTKVAAVLSPR